ncbi:hypothetical protein CMQ_832 [Grosmannia clavigera kw1407]|uniref:Uncharacterized protein n=1 Tax=Grosmannia clavigera (strain kw1407 / UAMH 11150) TaxID=655863 RepID=F0XF26_GROCL|nr:uncharacterized protein CMQ_832 [Grosmannia clavigera kw1407]EFX03904.1 hypothetical protein CMQ_832 [Grosmannia clavigera kw1407]
MPARSRARQVAMAGCIVVVVASLSSLEFSSSVLRMSYSAFTALTTPALDCQLEAAELPTTPYSGAGRSSTATYVILRVILRILYLIPKTTTSRTSLLQHLTMDDIAIYHIATLSWIGLQGLSLLAAPSFVVSLLATDLHVDDVAIYFARALGLAQLSFALLVIVLSGILPLGSVADSSTSSSSPYASAAVFVSTIYHSAAAFYSYGCYYSRVYASVGAYGVGCAGSGLLAAMGLWCLLFAGSNAGHISRRTGADKRTSGFPFTNAIADKRKA